MPKPQYFATMIRARRIDRDALNAGELYYYTIPGRKDRDTGCEILNGPFMAATHNETAGIVNGQGVWMALTRFPNVEFYKTLNEPETILEDFKEIKWPSTSTNSTESKK